MRVALANLYRAPPSHDCACLVSLYTILRRVQQYSSRTQPGQRSATVSQHLLRPLAAHLDVVLRVGLQRVDHVGELHAVADEEHGEVVAHHIVVALAGVELDGEAARVADRFGAPALMDDRREAHRDGRLDAGRAQEVGAGEAGHVVRHLQREAIVTSHVRKVRPPAARCAWHMHGTQPSQAMPRAHTGVQTVRTTKRPDSARPGVCQCRSRTGVRVARALRMRTDTANVARRTSKKPLADAPRACTTRSGMRSRSKLASFSTRW